MTKGLVLEVRLNVLRPPGGAVASGGEEEEATWWDNDGAIANCVGAWQAVGVADYATSKVNLANPGTYDLVDTEHVPDWTSANGWDFDGSSNYLETGVVPDGNNWTLVAMFLGGGEFGDGYVAGVDGEVILEDRELGVLPNASGLFRRYYYGGYDSFSGKIWSLGTWHTMAVVSDAAYKDGEAETDVAFSAAWDAGNAEDVYIGARNNGGSPDNHWSGYVGAVALYNAKLTAEEVSAVHTKMIALTLA